MLRKLLSVCALAVFLTMTGTAEAQTFDRRTYFTFNQTVMLPGLTLPAGTYLFRLVPGDWSRHVVQVANRGRDTHLRLKTWWYPGETVGREFLYSNEEERRLAGRREASTPVMGTR